MTQYTVVMQHGRPYRVPVEHAKKFIKKNELVTRAIGLKAVINDPTVNIAEKTVAQRELSEIMSKVIRLNRRIPPCAIPL